MKTLIIGLMLVGLVNSALALDKAELDRRIQMLTQSFDEMQIQPDKAVPADVLNKAHGIILLSRAKGGLVFSYQHGDGLALAKNARGAWSPAAFMTANEGGFGVQAGGEHSFFVILLMTTNATSMLTEGSVKFAGEARGTAGDSSAGEEGKMSTEPPILVYSSRTGFYGGAAIKGGAVAPDNDANKIYYGEYVTPNDILFEAKVKATEPATALAKKLTDYSRKPKK